MNACLSPLYVFAHTSTVAGFNSYKHVFKFCSAVSVFYTHPPTFYTHDHTHSSWRYQ